MQQGIGNFYYPLIPIFKLTQIVIYYNQINKLETHGKSGLLLLMDIALLETGEFYSYGRLL